MIDVDQKTTYLDLEEKPRFYRKAVDIIAWIEQNVDWDTMLIMKLDLRGFEYELLRRMAKRGVLDRVTELWFRCYYYTPLYGTWRSPRENWDRKYKECEDIVHEYRRKGIFINEWRDSKR